MIKCRVHLSMLLILVSVAGKGVWVIPIPLTSETLMAVVLRGETVRHSLLNRSRLT